MKATTIVAGIVVVVALAVGYWYLFMTDTGSPETTTPQSSTPSTTSPSSSEPSVATTTCPPADQVAASLTIEYRDGQYFVKGSDTASDTFCIRKGAPVTFTGSNLWVASDPHPIHSDQPEFDAKGEKESYTFTFDTTGEWGFHNHLRASDTGTIIVVE